MVEPVAPKGQLQIQAQNAQKTREVLQVESTRDDAQSTGKQVPQNRKTGTSDSEKESAEKSPSNALPQSVEELQTEVNNLNAILGANTSLRFRVHKETGAIFIEVVDTKTNEVLKKIPPDQLQNLRRNVRSGSVLVDRKS